MGNDSTGPSELPSGPPPTFPYRIEQDPYTGKYSYVGEDAKKDPYELRRKVQDLLRTEHPGIIVEELLRKIEFLEKDRTQLRDALEIADRRALDAVENLKEEEAAHKETVEYYEAEIAKQDDTIAKLEDELESMEL